MMGKNFMDDMDEYEKHSSMGFGEKIFEGVMVSLVHLAQMVTLEQKCRVVIDYDPEGITKVETYTRRGVCIPRDQEKWHRWSQLIPKELPEPLFRDTPTPDSNPSIDGKCDS